ncbi:MAG: hypothetical protein MUP30_03715, partial [Deltaproteobacteria bacterium]|nr:hypothetical protein [Deltaproteobacteria bacterium]
GGCPFYLYLEDEKAGRIRKKLKGSWVRGVDPTPLCEFTKAGCVAIRHPLNKNIRMVGDSWRQGSSESFYSFFNCAGRRCKYIF